MPELCLNKLILSTQWLHRNTPKQTVSYMSHLNAKEYLISTEVREYRFITFIHTYTNVHAHTHIFCLEPEVFVSIYIHMYARARIYRCKHSEPQTKYKQ